MTPIGKEANRLEEVQAGQVQDLDEVLESYSGPKERWNEVIRPILKQIPARRIADLTDYSVRWIHSIRNNSDIPSISTLERLTAIVKSLGKFHS